MRLKNLLPFVTLLCSWHVNACQQSLLEQELTNFTAAHKTGLSALVSQSGKAPCKAALGMANLELSAPVETDHIFEIGSLTKQFTAVAILLLEQEGQLSRSDPISKYIGGITTAKGKVTIEHLLSHTSGLVDPINNPEFLATRVQEPIAFADLVALFKNHHWQHEPGERSVYTNAGYSLLSAIIEEVSGLSYAAFLQKRIFAPLNMTSSSQASMAVTPNKVTGYTFTGSQPRQHDLLNLGWAYAAGDLLSNTRDLSIFSHALMQGKILNQQQLDVLFTPITLNDGTQTNGSYNASLQQISGRKAIRMSGSTLGFSSHSIYLPDEHTYFVVLNNSDGVNGGGWVRPATVVGKILANHLSLPLPDYQPIALTENQAQQLTGRYQLDEQTTRSITFKDGELFYQRNDGAIIPVVPMSGNRLYFADTLSYMQFLDVGTDSQSMAFYYFLSDEAEVANKIN